MYRKTGLSRAVVLHALTPGPRRQQQMDFCVQGQNGLQSEFWDSQVSTEKPYLENKSKKQRQTESGLKKS